MTSLNSSSLTGEWVENISKGEWVENISKGETSIKEFLASVDGIIKGKIGVNF